jgi:anti-sigma regulatory factor (Ser/Thr protein kinase)
MDFKINTEIKRLLKMGLPEDMAFIVAHANNGKAEEVQGYINLIEQEQKIIKDELKNFVPLEQSKPCTKCMQDCTCCQNILSISNNILDAQNEITNIQH